MTHKSDHLHSSLDIRLTESAVFLRSNDNFGRRHARGESRPALLRGLLVMNLTKPTKISSIELELSCKSSLSWPEGVGVRRMDTSEELDLFSESTVFFRASPPQRRHASLGPGVLLHDNEHVEDQWEHLHPHQIPDHSLRLRTTGLDPPHLIHIDTDTHRMVRSPSTHRQQDLPPTPPYTPESPSTPAHSPINRNSASFRWGENPSQTLEDFRNVLRANLNDRQSHSSPQSGHNPTISPQHVTGPSAASSSSSLNSVQERSQSRRRSIDDVPEDEAAAPTNLSVRHTTSPRSPSLTQSSETRSPSSSERRGRHRSRFSFASVSNVLFDAVHSKPSKMRSHTRNRSPDHSPEKSRSSRSRGRSLPKNNTEEPPAPKSALAMLGGILKHDDHDQHQQQQDARDWQMFKPGTYTYPVSFTIPGNAPPSLVCPFGSVMWELRAKVRRPGAFTSNLTARQDVMIVACPIEEDTEDTENIIVERQWEQQLQYLISIAGRSFYIGGTVPVQFTLMPLAKIRIYRMSIMIEERVDYLSNAGRVLRTDPTTRLLLLSVKNEGKDPQPILPLSSNKPDALLNSPLMQLVNSEDDDVSAKAAEYMGPGPWAFHQDLKLPASCSTLTPTSKNKKARVIVSHSLKVVLRVERGDDKHVESSGKRKLFDIVIQAPVTVLSCRCNPDWTSLPRYTEYFESSSTKRHTCPCNEKFAGIIERIESSDESSVEEAITQSMLDESAQFERLISGQETDAGEHPPQYTAVAA